jgi:carboxyl-terminal processing protease
MERTPGCEWLGTPRDPWRWLAVALVVAAVSCGGSSGTGDNPADRYLDEVLTLIQQNQIDRNEIDWATYQRQVRAAAAGATGLADLDPALQLAMDLLGDRHSFICRGQGTCLYQSVQSLGGWMGWSDPGALPAGVSYVRVERNYGSPLSRKALADQLQAAVQAQDRAGLVGWIVDLRENGGAARSDGQPQVSVTVPYTLLAPDPRVAMLQDGGTGSAGEAIAISFVGRPNTRSFGAASFGLSSANLNFSLSDGGDLQTAGSAEAVAAAVAWLTTP